MKKYRITHYTDSAGHECWRVQRKYLWFWVNISFVSNFSEDAAIDEMERHAGSRVKIHGVKEVSF